MKKRSTKYYKSNLKDLERINLEKRLAEFKNGSIKPAKVSNRPQAIGKTPLVRLRKRMRFENKTRKTFKCTVHKQKPECGTWIIPKTIKEKAERQHKPKNKPFMCKYSIEHYPRKQHEPEVHPSIRVAIMCKPGN